jgi:hypothetical protein
LLSINLVSFEDAPDLLEEGILKGGVALYERLEVRSPHK